MECVSRTSWILAGPSGRGKERGVGLKETPGAQLDEDGEEEWRGGPWGLIRRRDKMEINT